MRENSIMHKLAKIEKKVDALRKHMLDPDTILDEEDIAALQDAEKEEAAGKLISHKQLMRELGVNVRRRVH